MFTFGGFRHVFHVANPVAKEEIQEPDLAKRPRFPGISGLTCGGAARGEDLVLELFDSKASIGKIIRCGETNTRLQQGGCHFLAAPFPAPIRAGQGGPPPTGV
jgi:hypothetical protein